MIKVDLFWQMKVFRPLRVFHYSPWVYAVPLSYTLGYYREEPHGMALRCWQEVLNLGSYEYYETLETTKLKG